MQSSFRKERSCCKYSPGTEKDLSSQCLLPDCWDSEKGIGLLGVFQSSALWHFLSCHFYSLCSLFRGWRRWWDRRECRRCHPGEASTFQGWTEPHYCVAGIIHPWVRIPLFPQCKCPSSHPNATMYIQNACIITPAGNWPWTTATVPSLDCDPLEPLNSQLSSRARMLLAWLGSFSALELASKRREMAVHHEVSLEPGLWETLAQCQKGQREQGGSGSWAGCLTLTCMRKCVPRHCCQSRWWWIASAASQQKSF